MAGRKEGRKGASVSSRLFLPAAASNTPVLYFFRSCFRFQGSHAGDRQNVRSVASRLASSRIYYMIWQLERVFDHLDGGWKLLLAVTG